MTLTLVFQIDGRDYGLEIDVVQEIIEDPVRYPVPRSGPFLCGALNVHGEVLPVVDLPALMETTTTERDARLVVLSPEQRGVALLVNRVERIVSLDLDKRLLAEEVSADPYCRGLVERMDGSPVRLLDLDTVYTQLEQLFNDNGGTLCP